MTAADRLPAVIAAMVEVATHGTRSATDTLAPDHDLAAALSGAVDLAEVAPLLPLSGADHQRAAGLLRIIAGKTAQPLADAPGLAEMDRVLACRVAARLASSAALLLALDADALAGAAGVLWRAAGRLCGLATTPESAAGFTVPTLAETRERVAVDLSAHLAAADKRARDASAEVLRLHGELGKARKEAAGWHALVQEASQILGDAGFHGDNIVKQARRVAEPASSTQPAAEVLPRVVEWTDLQPGDLAWDANEFGRMVAERYAVLLKSAQAEVRAEEESGPNALWIQGRLGGMWHYYNGNKSGNYDVDARATRRAILISHNAPRTPSELRTLWERHRAAAHLLAEEARKPASA